MTPVITDYPVFEADQVLSQKHLNKLIGYLESQDRLTRVNILGMGIVCGLEIHRPNTTTLEISCGSAITSLGFLIPFETTRFTHYKETTLSDEFLNPDLEKHPYLEDIYQYTGIYTPFKDCLELLPPDSDDDGKEVLTEQILDDKVVMLLLEMPLIDEKNCVSIDCADKGKRLEFKPRPLLIDREALEDSQIRLNRCKNDFFKFKPLPKYNVPHTYLVTGQHLLDAFKVQIVKGKQDLDLAIKAVHDHYQEAFNGLSNYAVLGNVLSKINALQAQYANNIHLQYVADWMEDLAGTYREISEFNRCHPEVCCPDNGLHPFHVLLGLAEFETSDIQRGNELYRFRTPFIKTGILAVEEEVLRNKLKTLIQKLIHQLTNFHLHLDTIREKGIRITPSELGSEPLSGRAIPFYYKQITELVKHWSPEKTHKGIQDQILSYHAGEYNGTDEHVTSPLKYDTEPYNFYRIEGHIGMRYDQALATVVAQVNRNRLPFKVVGLNASNYLKKTVDISKHQGDWKDLELDYDMARTKVFNITEYVINWIKRNKTKIQANHPLMTDAVINDLSDILTQSRELLTNNLQEFLFEYEDFHEVFKRLNRIFVLHRACLLLLNPEDLNPIEEDLIDHFDEINRLFLEDPFTVIVTEAYRRWDKEYKHLFLAKFLEAHPGIEHKAGVPKGGTFIMVYVDSSIFAKPKFKGFLAAGLLTRIKNYENIFDFPEEERENIIDTNVLVKPMNYKLLGVTEKESSTENDCDKKIDKFKGTLLENARINFPGNMSPAVRDFLLDNMRNVFDRDFSEIIVNSRIPEDVIIADFYLPYICCSEGPGINIVLPPFNAEQTQLADFDHRDFNDDDFFTNKPE